MTDQSFGFTLIEILMVVSLIGVIACFGTVLSLSSISRASVVQERDQFVTLLLRNSRAAAIANLNETAHGVQFDNDNHRYILFTGTDPETSDPQTHRIIPYTSNTIRVTNTGGDVVVFSQLSGAVSIGAGIVSITNQTATRTVTIRSTGQIDW